MQGVYRSRDDPLFVEALAEVESVLSQDAGDQGQREVRAFFRAQMAYMLEGIDWRNPQLTWRPQAAG